METLENQIELLNRKLRFNRRLLIIWFIVMGVFIVAISLTVVRRPPLLKGTKLELGNWGNRSVLSGDGVTFYDKQDRVRAELRVEQEYAPYLQLNGNNSEARFGLHANGGGELLIQQSPNGNISGLRKAHLQISPETQQVSLLLSASGRGEVFMGINPDGEPELSLKAENGGKITMRVTSQGQPLLQMQDSQGKFVFKSPERSD